MTSFVDVELQYCPLVFFEPDRIKAIERRPSKALPVLKVEKEIKAIHLTCGEPVMAALDRISWRRRVYVSNSRGVKREK